MSGHETLPPAIVLGLSPTGLHVVRALAKAGVEVHGVAEGRQAGMLSRHLATVRSIEDEAMLLAHLVELAKGFESRGLSRAVLIASSDQHVEFIVRHAETLVQNFAFQPSYADGLASRIMAKDTFYAMCREQGVRYPQLIEVEAEDIGSLNTEIAFPCMIKPAEIHRVKQEMHGAKGWIVRNKSELAETARKIPVAAGTLLVQEIVPGPESAITLCCAWFDENSEPQQMFTARKLRQYPSGFGSASLVQSHPEEESARAAAGLLRSIGYQGIAAAEFKRHPDTGELYIIEVNVRPSLWFSVSDDSGRPVVLAAYRAMAGLAPMAERKQEQGVRWHYWLKDTASRLFYLRKRKFVLPAPDTETCGPARRIVHPVYARDDRRPAWGEVRFLLQKAAARLRAR